MNHAKLLWHDTEPGYLDLRSTDHDNHIGPVEHLQQCSARYLGRRTLIWMAQGRYMPRRRLLTRIRLKVATSPVPDDASVWVS